MLVLGATFAVVLSAHPVARGHEGPSDARMRAAVSAAISAQISNCSKRGSGDTAAVVVHFELETDGTISGEPYEVRDDCMPPAEEADRKKALEVAIASLHCVAPFRLPVEHYNLWRTVNWKFGPTEARATRLQEMKCRVQARKRMLRKGDVQ